jgi:hypothetical protein
VYRLAYQVYVMGVAPAHGNVFFAARVVNAATHHLVAVNRGISVTPDRIANRFPEVGPAKHDAACDIVGSANFHIVALGYGLRRRPHAHQMHCKHIHKADEWPECKAVRLRHWPASAAGGFDAS